MSRFFILTPGQCRRAVLALNSYTRWGFDTLMEMDTGALFEWLQSARDLYRDT